MDWNLNEELVRGGSLGFVATTVLMILRYAYRAVANSASVTLTRTVDGMWFAKVRYGWMLGKYPAREEVAHMRSPVRYEWTCTRRLQLAHRFKNSETALVIAKGILSRYGCRADTPLSVKHVPDVEPEVQD